MKNRFSRIALLLVLASVLLSGAAVAQQEAPDLDTTASESATPENAPLENTAQESTAPTGSAPEGVSEALGSAVTEAAGTVQSGTTEVAASGKRVWTSALQPFLDRMASSLPTLLKAVALLLLFWIVAMVLSTAVRTLLNLTKVDERAVEDWGLGDMLTSDDGTSRSIAGMAATAVKWLILLLGLVAFFDALQLAMVAGPLQGILDKITEVVPAFLEAALILAVFWVIGTLLKLGVTRGLEAAGFDQRAGKYIQSREVDGEEVGPSAMLGRLLFYIVLLFGIPPFLDALGQQSLVEPLTEMFAKILAFLPNLVAAAVIFFIARIVATIVREVVSNLLAAAGADEFAARFGFGSSEGSKKLSEIVGSVTFFFIMVPMLVVAVEKLQMRAISDPVKATLEQVLSAIPHIFLAFLIFAIGFFIAKTVRGLVESFLSGIGFDQLPKKIGLNFLQPNEGAPSLSSIGGTVVFAIILLMLSETALAALQLGPLSNLAGGLIGYLPSLFVGLLVILVALSLGSYVANLIQRTLSGSEHVGLVSTVAKYAIFFLGFSMGLNQLGVGEEIIRIAVSAVLGGTALALGLAFGLGGRDRAKEVIDRNSRF